MHGFVYFCSSNNRSADLWECVESAVRALFENYHKYKNNKVFQNSIWHQSVAREGKIISSVVRGVELTTVVMCWTAGECSVSRCTALQGQKTPWLHALLTPSDTVTVVTEPRWMHGRTFCIHSSISHTSWKMYWTQVHITEQLNYLKLVTDLSEVWFSI
jgi:hypothetical protein